MPDERRRAFRPEFLAHARKHKGWPVEASVKSWCGENERSFMQNGVYSQIANGGYSSARHIELILEYILDSKHEHHVERRSFQKFVAADTAAAAPTLVSTIDLVSVVEEHPDLGFGMGVKALHWFFEHEVLRMPARLVRPVETEDEARDAAYWVCVDAGRQLAGPVDSAGALRAAQARMGLALGEYQETVVAWWRRNPWTVVQARPRRGNGSLGACVALPVRDSFLDRVKAGTCATHQCTPHEVLAESANLVIEGVSELGDSSERGRVGLGLLAASICQLAKLSDVPGLCRVHPLRVVSFFGTPVGKRRLKWFGFRPLGTYFPGTRIEYAERELGLRGRGFRDGSLVGVWQALQLHMREVHGAPRGPTE